MKYTIITPDNFSHQKSSEVQYNNVVAIKNKNKWEIKKWCKNFKEATICVSKLTESVEVIILPVCSFLPQPIPNPDFSN